MSRRAAITIAVVACAVVLLSIGLWVVSHAKAKRMLHSDVNHAIYLFARLEQEYFWASNPPPYQAGVPGHIMMENICSNYPVAWCNHGLKAGYRHSGWQAVNLSPEKWVAFKKASATQKGEEIPFAWCGRQTGLNKRMVFFVHSHHPAYFRFRIISEDDIRRQVERVSTVLSKLGSEPVPLDIPDRNEER